MTAVTKLMTPGGGGVSLTPASSIASDVTVNVPSQNCTLGIQGPAFSYYASTGTTLTAGAWTKVTYNTQEFDTNSNVGSSKFTASVAGVYQINCSVAFYNAGGSERALGIYKNGTLFKNATDFAISGASVLTASILIKLSVNDYVEIYAYSSNSITTGNDSIGSTFSGALVRAD